MISTEPSGRAATEPARARTRHPTSTTQDLPPPGTADRWGVWGRRAFLALLTLVVIAGLTGFLGVKARSVRAKGTGSGTSLQVHYAQVGRAGLDVPFEITVRRTGGFGRTGVALAVSSSYLEIFDRSSIDPQPVSETTDASRVIFTFDPPPGDTLVVSLDLQVQAGRHAGRNGTVSVLGAHGEPVTTASFKTWLVP